MSQAPYPSGGPLSYDAGDGDSACLWRWGQDARRDPSLDGHAQLESYEAEEAEAVTDEGDADDHP